MTSLDDDEESFLAQARRALSPTSADERRILQSVLPRLTLAADAPGGKPEAGPSWALRAAGTVAVIGALGLSGGLGYRKGVAAGIAQQTKANVGSNSHAVAALVPAPTRLEPSPPIEPERPINHHRPTALSPSLANPSKAAASAAAARGEAQAPPAALGLDEEVRQLRRVERAIRESNPRLALVLLEELDQAIPRGQLLQERQAASIMANCQLGADAAQADARAFAAAHAGSAYLTRVIEICALDSAAGERILPPSGTHVPR